MVHDSIAAGCNYKLGQYTFYVDQPYHEHGGLVLIFADSMLAPADRLGTLDADAGDAFGQAAVNDLLASLYLYIGRYEWSQLTTKQKELFADRIDTSHAHTSEAGELHEVDRWWREDAPLREPAQADQDLTSFSSNFPANCSNAGPPSAGTQSTSRIRQNCLLRRGCSHGRRIQLRMQSFGLWTRMAGTPWGSVTTPKPP